MVMSSAWMLGRQIVGGALTFLVHLINLIQVGARCAQISWQTRGKTWTDTVDTQGTDWTSCKISCVLPARNEEQGIEKTLRRLADAAAQPELMEIVLVDSNCTDATMTIAEAVGKDLPCALRLLKSTKPGRGAALDLGSEQASGDVIFVLHADSVAPKGFDDRIRTGLAKPGVIATCFHFEMNPELLEGPLPGRIVANFMINFKNVLFKFPFGDQGWALPKARLASYGYWAGKDHPIMEDFHMAENVRTDYAKGFGRLEVLPGSTGCNPRRWSTFGVWKVNLVNQLVIFCYFTGLTTGKDLFDLYYGGMRPKPFSVGWALKNIRAFLLH